MTCNESVISKINNIISRVFGIFNIPLVHRNIICTILYRKIGIRFLSYSYNHVLMRLFAFAVLVIGLEFCFAGLS